MFPLVSLLLLSSCVIDSDLLKIYNETDIGTIVVRNQSVLIFEIVTSLNTTGKPDLAVGLERKVAINDERRAQGTLKMNHTQNHKPIPKLSDENPLGKQEHRFNRDAHGRSLRLSSSPSKYQSKKTVQFHLSDCLSMILCLAVLLPTAYTLFIPS